MRTTECMVEALSDLRSDPNRVPDEEFWHVVERYRATLVNQALTILDCQEDAEDVAQETLCKAFTALHQLRDVTKLGVWLRAINHRNALALRRRQMDLNEQRLATGQAGQIPAPRTGRTTALRRTAADKVLCAIDALPESFRDVIVLRYWERLNNDQIAARLEIPVGTVRSRLARADRMLTEKLRAIVSQENHPQ